VAKGVVVVQTCPVEGREDEFNDWYSNVHVPELLEIDGFVDARRFRAVDGSHYVAVYEIEADDLGAPMAEFRERAAAGRTTRSEALGTDPAPVVTIYELID
jgi:hypothetical protein